MGSKYDDYWAGQLPQIRAQVQRAAAGAPAMVSVPDLTRLGARRSWHGVAEVRAQEMTYSSMAHATSLGKTVTASGICGQWPERAFRFTIGPGGDVLTITATWLDRHRPPGERASQEADIEREVSRHIGAQISGRWAFESTSSPSCASDYREGFLAERPFACSHRLKRIQHNA